MVGLSPQLHLTTSANRDCVYNSAISQQQHSEGYSTKQGKAVAGMAGVIGRSVRMAAFMRV